MGDEFFGAPFCFFHVWSLVFGLSELTPSSAPSWDFFVGKLGILQGLPSSASWPPASELGMAFFVIRFQKLHFSLSHGKVFGQQISIIARLLTELVNRGCRLAIFQR
jgi:hypothetical protein